MNQSKLNEEGENVKSDDSLKTSVLKKATQKYISYIGITFDAQVSLLQNEMVHA